MRVSCSAAGQLCAQDQSDHRSCSLPHVPPPILWGLPGGGGQPAVIQGSHPSPGDNAREDLHPPDSGECRGCQVSPGPPRLSPQIRGPPALGPPAPHLLCCRDAIAKVLYALLFGWLIARVNALVSPRQDTLSIAILDIYGFEVGLHGWVRDRGHKTSSLSRLCL